MINEYFKELNKLNDIYESFEIHSQLNNKIFNLDDNLMKQEIRQRLIEIADLFVSSIQENNVPIKVYDYWLVGSNAAYNYNKDSDIDIHIIVDMNIVADQYLLRLLYDYIKSSFSQKYNIEVKGHEVELYLEDIKTTAITNGIYSLKQDKWLKFPQEQEPRIIDIEETPLFAEWLDRYQSLEDEECEQFLDDLYVMRKISLANEGEFGTGNLVFKEFRNRGYLDDLKDRKYKFESDRLTLEKLEEVTLSKTNRNSFYKGFKEAFLCLINNNYEEIIKKEIGRHGQTYLKMYLCLQRDITYDSKLHVHHIDGDYTNNADSNLVILTASQHKSLHEKALDLALEHILTYPDFSKWTKKKIHSELAINKVPEDIFLSAASIYGESLVSIGKKYKEQQITKIR